MEQIESWSLLIPGTLLSDTVASIGAVPVDKKWGVKSVVVVNTDNSDCTFTMHWVPNGGSPDESNMIVNDRTVTAKDTIRLEFNDIIEAEGSIQAFCAVSGQIQLRVSGAVIGEVS